jgi:ribosomal protein S18 acetylase RimI-like enzyme
VPVFEQYRRTLDKGERLAAVAIEDLLIRPALPTDATELGRIEAAREGGDAAQYASRLERAILSLGTASEGLILAAQHSGKLVGTAKVRHFVPSNDAPRNVAPAGWYLSGVIVVPEYRRRGIGRHLTEARLDWIAQRDQWAYYFSNAQNRVSIELHQQFGFVELTRDFTYPGVMFEGGIGVLFRAELSRTCTRLIRRRWPDSQ